MVDSLRVIAKSTGLNMIAQVAIRLFSFIVNAIIIRFVSIDYIGIVNVRLTLLVTTSIFLAREPIRKACFDQGKEDWKQINQLSWLSVPIGLLIVSVLSLIWIYVLPDPGVEFYKESVIIYAISTLIALTSESSYILTQLSLHTNTKVFVESTALMIRSCMNCLLLALYPSLKLKAFCISELIYSLSYPLLYSIHILYLLYHPNPSKPLLIHSFNQLLPSFSFHLPSQTYSILLLFFKQSILKQLLTEGEKYVLSISPASMYDQGLYEIVNNLGSLFARFLFQPLEEGFYLYVKQSSNRDEKNEGLLDVTLSLLRCLCYFGCLVIGFGYSYASALLYLYGGSNLAIPIAVNMLRVYCVYVLFLGCNGISEAFFMGTASTRRLESFNHIMGWFSVLFILISLLLTYPFIIIIILMILNH